MEEYLIRGFMCINSINCKKPIWGYPDTLMIIHAQLESDDSFRERSRRFTAVKGSPPSKALPHSVVAELSKALPPLSKVLRTLGKRSKGITLCNLKRSSYGFSHGSILICDYLANGTLQDVVNSYLVLGKSMEEVLCIYYTIEILYMAETLHGVGLIHGDFKDKLFNVLERK
ncbi:hypothetical protein LR48_Vigan04g058600 [Vigna angularis]|uniref:Protein kinase domain-containing protein n=1 Tax=Phaseolus angularis TaxID=3914 RepID=A0A0L9UC97_PHAAN|nr:hypothetical protein LR48_Vigan04g058600 [Vigna angularis]